MSVSRMIDLSCFCGRKGSIPMLAMGETRNLKCARCASPIQIWRADNIGGPGQIRYRSDRTFVQRAPVAFERLSSDPGEASKIRNGGTATGVLSPRILRDVTKLREIMLAGQAEITLVYVPKGQTQSVRVTFRLGYMTAAYAARNRVTRAYRVKVTDANALTRQSPELGTISSEGVFTEDRKVDPAMMKHLAVFKRFFEGSGTKDRPGTWADIPASLEIWRGTRCVRCGRRLTDPDSIHSGWGAKCARDAGVTRAKAPLAEPAMGEGALVFRDIMQDLDITDPSSPVVLRTALQRMDAGGDTGEIARMAIEHACKVLGMTEAQLREACSLDPEDGDSEDSEEDSE